MPPTIIDGYNLIFTCGLEGKSRSPQSIEKARARLIAIVAAHQNESDRNATTIVFDAKQLPIKETSADSTVEGIRILYAVEHEDADSLIEELIRRHSTPKKLTVVSSDHRIQTAATRRKAIAVDSDVWYDQLMSRVDGSEDDEGNVQSDDKQLAAHELSSIDWTSEFASTTDPDSESTEIDDTNAPNKPSFNPFPPGYGEDLTE